MKYTIYTLILFSFAINDLAGQNVGIGTQNPETALHVHDASGDNIIMQKLTTPSSETEFGFNTNIGAILGTVSNHDLRIRTNKFSRIVVGKNGFVGIGSGIPSEKLHIQDGNIFLSNLGGTNTKGLLFGESNDPLFGWIYDGIGSGSNNQLHLREFLGTPSDILTIKGDGLVGFGTNEPKAKVHVKEDGTAGTGTIVAVLESNISNRPILQFSETANGDANSGMSIEYDGSGTGSDNKMYINNTNGSPVVTFESSGDIKVEQLEGNSRRALYAEADGTIITGPETIYHSGASFGSTSNFRENIHIPDGAKLISIEFRYLDNTDEDELYFYVSKRQNVASGQEYIINSSTGLTTSSPTKKVRLVNFSNAEPTVNNKDFSYQIDVYRFESIIGPGTDLLFYSYRLKYTLE